MQQQFAISKVLNRFRQKDERTSTVLRNVFMSFGVKLGSITIGILLVPLTINYVNPMQYGIWLTLSSLLNWISFFDIGLGNGLRNSLSHNLALGNYEEAKKAVSTTYLVIAGISVLLFLLFQSLNLIVDWNNALNIPAGSGVNIKLAISIIALAFVLQFVFQLLNTILIATHKTALSSFITFLGQLTALVSIFILTKASSGSFDLLVIALTASPIIVLLIANIYFFSTSLSHLAPSWKGVQIKIAKSIVQSGSSFFFIQIGSLILFQTSNIVLSRVLGPVSVTEFNVCYKLYAVIIMVFSIIIAPYWSAFTDAFAKQDYDWMKASVASLRKIWLLLMLSILPLMFLASDYIYSVWIGGSVSVSTSLSLSMVLYTIAYTCMSLNCSLLNGLGKIRIQIYLYTFTVFANVPLSVLLAKQIGTSGVVLANTAVMTIINIVLWVQINKIMNNRATGDWNR